MISWFYNLLALSISITPIILLLLWLGPVLNQKYSARWRCILWLVVSLRLLWPVSFMNIAPLSIQVPAPEVNGGLTPSAAISGPLTKISTDNLPGADISLGQILLVIYLLGVLAYLFRAIYAYVGFRRNVLRWSRKPSDDGMEKLLAELKTELHVQREISVRISKKVSSPMIVGLVRTTLLLPTESYTHTERSMILTHELVHLRRHDIGYKLLLMITSAVHWFNPAVHLMVRAATQDIEISCDNYVLRNTNVDARKYYCHLILNLAIQKDHPEGPILSTGISSSKNTLETRIKSIFDTTKKRRGIGAIVAITVLVTISGVMININSAASTFTSQPLPIESGEIIVDTIADTVNRAGEYSEMEQTAPPEKAISKSTTAEAEPIRRSEQKIINGKTSQDNYTDNKEETWPSNKNRAEVVIIDLNKLEDDNLTGN